MKNELKTYEITARGYVDHTVEIDAETKEANKLNLAFYHFSTAIIEQIGFDEFMKKQTELRNGFDALYADSK